MAMPLQYAIKTSLRKYRRSPWRTFFSVSPFILLLVIVVVFTNITTSIERFILDKVINVIEIQEGQIRVTRGNSGFIITDPFSTAPHSSVYTEEEISKINKLSHVKHTAIQKSFPPVRATTTDLAIGKELFIQNIKLASPDSVRPYTQAAFDYNEKQPIPIILNWNVLNHAYVDMGSIDKLIISQEALYDYELRQQEYPIKIDSLEHRYSHDELIGKIFTLKVGGFPNVPAVSATSTNGDLIDTFIMRTEQDRSKVLQERIDSISQYWDYNLLDQGMDYKFQIIGINNDQDVTASFIPMEAGAAIFQQVYDLQVQARTTKPLPENSFGKTFGGLRIVSDGTLMPFALKTYSHAATPPLEELIALPADLGGTVRDADFAIPGWIYTAENIDGLQEPVEPKELKITPLSFGATDIVAILDDASNRMKVISALNDSGFSSDITNSSGIIDRVRMTKEMISDLSRVVIAILAIFSLFLLITLVWRLVSDAQREIGIYRALGARKINIGVLYAVYTTTQVMIGLVVGLVVGVVVTKMLAAHLVQYVRGFWMWPELSMSRYDSGGTYLILTTADFHYIDYLKLALYVVAIILFVLLASLVPAWRAANISPIKAIRSSE